MKTSPKLTVLVPVFNGEKYLKECLDSVLNQTFTDLECLVIDDGSTDGSEEIIKAVPDPRIRYVKNDKNLGIANTRNKGFALASGEYIAFQDCDDISVPHRLERQVAFMDSNPAIGVCGGCMQTINAEGALLKDEIWECPPDHQRISRYLAFGCTLWNPTLIIRKSVIDAHALNHDPVYVAASDLDWYIRLAKVTQLANMQEVLTYYRKHGRQITRERVAISRRNSNNLHMGLMLEEIKKFRPDVKGEIKAVTAEMTELTFLRNLVLIDCLMADWPAPDEETSEEFLVYNVLKGFLDHIWKETTRFMPVYTPQAFQIMKDSPFFKSLPTDVQVEVEQKCHKNSPFTSRQKHSEGTPVKDL